MLSGHAAQLYVPRWNIFPCVEAFLLHSGRYFSLAGAIRRPPRQVPPHTHKPARRRSPGELNAGDYAVRAANCMVSLEADAFKRFAKSLHPSGEVDFDFARKTVACFFQRIGACRRMCNPQCSHGGNCPPHCNRWYARILAGAITRASGTSLRLTSTSDAARPDHLTGKRKYQTRHHKPTALAASQGRRLK